MKRHLHFLFLLLFVTLAVCACSNKTAPAPEQTPQPVETVKPNDVINDNSKNEGSNQPSPQADTKRLPPSPKKDIRLVTSCAPQKTIEVLPNGFTRDDGTYSTRAFVDGWVSYYVERLQKSKDNTDDIIKNITILQDAELRDFKFEVDQSLSQKWNMKTYKITYLSGHNEDTTSNVDYYFLGDDFDYRLHMACNDNFIDEFGQPIMDELIKNLKFETK